MSRATSMLAALAGAIAGGAVGLAVSSGGNNTTRNVTTVVSGTTSGSSLPTSFSKTQPGLSINQIYQLASPGVVDINVTSVQQGGNLGFFGGNGQQLQQGEGSGVVYNKSGYIITDEHVVANATNVKVNFWNGKSYPAKVVGMDPSTDVAVIKVNAPASELHPIAFANSDQAQVGDPVVAIGSPFSYPETVTAGIVSQVGRSIPAPNGFTIAGAIQTDAAINPGNSGGPLLDAAGQVIGLNDQIETSTQSVTGQGQSSGVGFATPGNTDVQVANDIIAGRPVRHAYVGVCLAGSGTGNTGGAQIAPTSCSTNGGGSPITPGSPAAQAGLQPGDVITAIDGKTVQNTENFITMIAGYEPGQTITLTVKRGTRTMQFRLTLANRPQQAPTSG